MTDTIPAPALAISAALSDLLLWLLEDHDVGLAKEVIAKPWHFADLSAIHAANPVLDVEDALEVLDAQQRDD